MGSFLQKSIPSLIHPLSDPSYDTCCPVRVDAGQRLSSFVSCLTVPRCLPEKQNTPRSPMRISSVSAGCWPKRTIPWPRRPGTHRLRGSRNGGRPMPVVEAPPAPPPRARERNARRRPSGRPREREDPRTERRREAAATRSSKKGEIHRRRRRRPRPPARAKSPRSPSGRSGAWKTWRISSPKNRGGTGRW